MIFDTVQTLLLFINFNFVFFGISLLFTKKGNIQANHILSVFLLILAWVNTHYVFHYDKSIFLNFPNLIGTHMPFLFVLPPMLFFYFRKVFGSGFKILGANLLHFLPAIAVAVYYLPLYSESIDYKINFINTGICYVNSYQFSVFFFTHFIIYLAAISYLILNQTRKVKAENLISLLNYTRGALFLSFGIIILLILSISLGFKFIYAATATSLFYYFLIYQVFFRPEVFFSLQLIGEANPVRYSEKSMSVYEVEKINHLLEAHLKEKQVFLDNGLSLPQIAKTLGIPIHQLSQAINRKNMLNFNELINKYRVEYARECLLNKNLQQYTIEAIGNMSGFNTRQTFISAFKKFYNSTPSQYIKLKDRNTALSEN